MGADVLGAMPENDDDLFNAGAPKMLQAGLDYCGVTER